MRVPSAAVFTCVKSSLPNALQPVPMPSTNAFGNVAGSSAHTTLAIPAKTNRDAANRTVKSREKMRVEGAVTPNLTSLRTNERDSAMIRPPSSLGDELLADFVPTSLDNRKRQSGKRKPHNNPNIPTNPKNRRFPQIRPNRQSRRKVPDPKPPIPLATAENVDSTVASRESQGGNLQARIARPGFSVRVHRNEIAGLGFPEMGSPSVD